MPELNPYAPPPSQSDPRESRPALAPVAFAARLAGWFMVANALLVAVVSFTVADKVPGGGTQSHVGPICDLVIGASLAWGHRQYVTWALVRCALGVLVLGGIAVYHGDYIELVFQLALSGSLFALLAGAPGVARVGWRASCLRSTRSCPSSAHGS